MEVYQSSKTAAEMEFALKAIPSIGANNHWFIGDVDTGVLAEGLTPYVGANGNWWVGETDTGVYAGGVKVTGAEVGQTIVVKAVDENGKPTEWECAELPSGAKLLASMTLQEDVSDVYITLDDNGNSLSFNECLLLATFTGTSANTTEQMVCAEGVINGNLVAAGNNLGWNYASRITGTLTGVLRVTQRSNFSVFEVIPTSTQGYAKAVSVASTDSPSMGGLHLWCKGDGLIAAGSTFEIWGV